MNEPLTHTARIVLCAWQGTMPMSFFTLPEDQARERKRKEPQLLIVGEAQELTWIIADKKCPHCQGPLRDEDLLPAPKPTVDVTGLGRYKTRDGRIATLTHAGPDPQFGWIGTIEGAPKTWTGEWNDKGRYFGGFIPATGDSIDHSNDLVERIS